MTDQTPEEIATQAMRIPGYVPARDEGAPNYIIPCRKDPSHKGYSIGCYCKQCWEDEKKANADKALRYCPRHGAYPSVNLSCPQCDPLQVDAWFPNAALDPKAAAGALKAPLWLVPPAAEEELAKALALGAGKYGEWNWRKAKVKRSVYLSAMKRHIGRILDGEDIDPESGAHHLGHVMANCAIILDAARHGTLVIDGEEPGA